MPLFERNTLVS